MKTSAILRAIGNENLALVRGKGYWYFVYDNGTLYETHSVMTVRLSDLPIGSWVSEGREFCRRVESEGAVSS